VTAAADVEAVVRAVFDAFERHDMEAYWSFFAEDAVVFMRPEVGSNAGTFRGRAEIERWTQAWEEAWERTEYAPVSFEHVTPDDVVVEVRTRAVGRASGIELEMPIFYAVRTRDLKGYFWGLYLSREDALGGIRESPGVELPAA
jgi:ketosteroid isomerase-like protein